MRILHLSTYDVFGGAARAACRLHDALRVAGCDSHMLVRRRYGAGTNVKEAGGRMGRWHGMLQRRIDLWIARIGGMRQGGSFSPALAPDLVLREVERSRPDIVHVHWTCDGFLSLATLAALGRPIVWTFHDMWAFTGGCHYAGDCVRFHRDCGCCPQLGARRQHDLSRSRWRQRARLLGEINVTGVAPSRWMERLARASSLWRERPLYRIPYGIDVTRFASRDRRAARMALKLPPHHRIVIAGAAGFRTQPRKGFDLFCAIAKAIAPHVCSPCTFAIFGDGIPGGVDIDGITLRSLGYVGDEDRMADIYAAADFFVAPSREDNLPNTVIESLASGTPAAAFAIGGLPELIDDGLDGLLAAAFDPADLGRRIAGVLDDTVSLDRMRDAARRKADANFTREKMAAMHLALYHEVAR